MDNLSFFNFNMLTTLDIYDKQVRYIVYERTEEEQKVSKLQKLFLKKNDKAAGKHWYREKVTEEELDGYLKGTYIFTPNPNNNEIVEEAKNLDDINVIANNKWYHTLNDSKYCFWVDSTPHTGQDGITYYIVYRKYNITMVFGSGGLCNYFQIYFNTLEDLKDYIHQIISISPSIGNMINRKKLESDNITGDYLLKHYTEEKNDE